MQTSEITEENDEDMSPFIVNPDLQKERIRRLLQHQKSLYCSSSSPLYCSAASCSSSSSSSSHQSSSLVTLMKGGSTSLGRLFDMEHTSLATYFQDYSGSPAVKHIPLWGSDTDDEMRDPWEGIKSLGSLRNAETDGQASNIASDGTLKNIGFSLKNTRKQNNKRNPTLGRKKSFRRLPRFGFWRSSRFFRFRFRLRRLKIMICGRIL